MSSSTVNGVGRAGRDQQRAESVKSPVNSTAKSMAVSGERMVPPIIAAMPIKAQRP